MFLYYASDLEISTWARRADQPIQRIRRELNTSRSQPGRYTLTVMVQTADNRRAERQTTLIVDPERH